MEKIMKKVLWAGMLALAGLALASDARAGGCGPGGGHCGHLDHCRFWRGMHYNLRPECALLQLGPWYLYYPHDAYFQVPAPTAYPYWPAPQTLNASQLGAASGPYTQTMPNPYGVYQPVGYYQQGPSYWYGH
jgi:hypothetical protein